MVLRSRGILVYKSEMVGWILDRQLRCKTEFDGPGGGGGAWQQFTQGAERGKAGPADVTCRTCDFGVCPTTQHLVPPGCPGPECVHARYRRQMPMYKFWITSPQRMHDAQVVCSLCDFTREADVASRTLTPSFLSLSRPNKVTYIEHCPVLFHFPYTPAPPH